MGQFQWPDRRGDQEVILTREPEAGFLKRIKVILLRMVPMKSQFRNTRRVASFGAAISRAA